MASSSTQDQSSFPEFEKIKRAYSEKKENKESES
jgi:hypothetical protein